MLSVELATETYCRDETDSIKQTGGPDFVTESWIYVIDLDLYTIRVLWAPWAPWARPQQSRMLTCLHGIAEDSLCDEHLHGNREPIGKIYKYRGNHEPP